MKTEKNNMDKNIFSDDELAGMELFAAYLDGNTTSAENDAIRSDMASDCRMREAERIVNELKTPEDEAEIFSEQDDCAGHYSADELANFENALARATRMIRNKKSGTTGGKSAATTSEPVLLTVIDHTPSLAATDDYPVRRTAVDKSADDVIKRTAAQLFADETENNSYIMHADNRLFRDRAEVPVPVEVEEIPAHRKPPKRAIIVGITAVIAVAASIGLYVSHPDRTPGRAEDQPTALYVTPPVSKSGAAEGADAIRPAEQIVRPSSNMLYVYKDVGSNANHFLQRVWMGNMNNIPPMREASEGVENSTAIEAVLNKSHAWGGYFFTVGIFTDINEPPKPNFGDYDVCFDLTGAKRLTFYAKGSQGDEVIEFYTAGLGYGEGYTKKYPDSSQKISLGFVKLKNNWQKYTINLAGSDLSRIGCGFGWVTTFERNPDKDEIRFYMDEIRFEFE